MSALNINYAWLICDDCKTVFRTPGRPVEMLRQRATDAGWKCDRVPYGKSHWSRVLDLCPTCAGPSA